MKRNVCLELKLGKHITLEHVIKGKVLSVGSSISISDASEKSICAPEGI